MKKVEAKTTSYKALKCPKTAAFWLTLFGSFICTKQLRFVFCHVGLYLPRWKTTRFGLSKGRESIKMKVGIFKWQLFLFSKYLQKFEKFKI